MTYLIKTPLIKEFDNEGGTFYDTRQQDWATSPGGENDASNDDIVAYDFEIVKIYKNGEKESVGKKQIILSETIFHNLKHHPGKDNKAGNKEIQEETDLILAKFPEIEYIIDGHIIFDFLPEQMELYELGGVTKVEKTIRYSHEDFNIGDSIILGKEFCEENGFPYTGKELNFVKGSFDADNGLYAYTEYAISLASIDICATEDYVTGEDEYESIFHLFGNNLDGCMDCKMTLKSQQKEVITSSEDITNNDCVKVNSPKM